MRGAEYAPPLDNGQGTKRGRMSREIRAVAASNERPDDHGVAGERQQLVAGI
jgi:hypothetical protein